MEIIEDVKFIDECYYSLSIKHGDEVLEVEYNINNKEWLITKNVEDDYWQGRIHLKSGKNFNFSLHNDNVDIENLSIEKITLFQRTYNAIKHILTIK